MIACQQGRFAEGIELARRSLASEPHQPRAHNLLGMALSRLGRHEEALASFDHAIVHQPDFADAHGNRASALRELGRTAEAVASYERAVALQPDSIGDWLNLGTALHRLGRHDDAIGSYDRALALQAELSRSPFQPRQRARPARALRGGAGELRPGARAPIGATSMRFNGRGSVLLTARPDRRRAVANFEKRTCARA